MKGCCFVWLSPPSPRVFLKKVAVFVLLREAWPGVGRQAATVCPSQSSKHLNLEESLKRFVTFQGPMALKHGAAPQEIFIYFTVFVLHVLMHKTTKQTDTHKVVNALFFPASQRSLWIKMILCLKSRSVRKGKACVLWDMWRRKGSLWSSAITKTQMCVCVWTSLCADSLKQQCRGPKLFSRCLRDTTWDAAHIPIKNSFCR